MIKQIISIIQMKHESLFFFFPFLTMTREYLQGTHGGHRWRGGGHGPSQGSAGLQVCRAGMGGPLQESPA